MTSVPAHQRLLRLQERIRAIVADSLADQLADELAGAVLDHVEREGNLVRAQLAETLLAAILCAGHRKA